MPGRGHRHHPLPGTGVPARASPRWWVGGAPSWAATYARRVETTRANRLLAEHQATHGVPAGLVRAISCAEASRVGSALFRSPGGRGPAVVVGPLEA
jgi:hypothetical protein